MNAKEEQEQRRSELLTTSNRAIASQQEVADTFFKAGVLKSKVDVKPV
jgi:sulfonate transport system substrate-binding protein